MRHFIASITSSCFTFCDKRAESHHHGGNLKRNQIWEQKHKNPSLSLILPCTEWTLEVACSGGGTVIERTSALEKKNCRCSRRELCVTESTTYRFSQDRGSLFDYLINNLNFILLYRQIRIMISFIGNGTFKWSLMDNFVQKKNLYHLQITVK